MVKFILIKSPDEWATTKQACRDELVVYLFFSPIYIYLTVILRGRAGYPASPRRITVLVNFQAILLISSGETSSNRDIFFTDDAAKKNFSDFQNFSTRNSLSVFPYLVKLNDNGSYHGLREPIRKLENHYPELKIY